MPDSLLDTLQKYWLVITGFIATVVFFVTTRENTDMNTSAIEKEKKAREDADAELKEEIRRVEERLVARQNSDVQNINSRFDDLKYDLRQVSLSITELLKR